MSRTAKTLKEKIAEQQAKLAQLREQKARLDAREKSRANKEARAADTRRKIIVGALVLSEIENGRIQKSFLYEILDARLDRPNDRQLFELPPHVKSSDLPSAMQTDVSGN